MELIDYRKAYYELLDAANISRTHTHKDVLKYLKTKDEDHYNLSVIKLQIEKLYDIMERM